MRIVSRYTEPYLWTFDVLKGEELTLATTVCGLKLLVYDRYSRYTEPYLWTFDVLKGEQRALTAHLRSECSVAAATCA
jgi:hypothetical protein